MELPTYYNHCRGIGVDILDRRPYVVRYLEAKGMDIRRYGELARLAFNLVQAKARLNDISQTIATENSRRLAAQQDEIVGWQNKVDRYTQGPASILFFNEMVGDFSIMAEQARQPDEAERTLTALGLEGRIGEVVTKAADKEPYSWQIGPTGARDSAFARKS